MKGLLARVFDQVMDYLLLVDACALEGYIVTSYGMLSRSTTRIVSCRSLYLYSILLSLINKVSVRVGTFRYSPLLLECFEVYD